MIIRISLLLIVCAFLLIAAADVFLELTLLTLSEFSTQLGLGLLFCAFISLLILGLWFISQQIVLAIKNYFSATERRQRRVLFVQAKTQQLKQQFYCRALRIHYFHELKRKQLLRQHQRKHIKALSKAIANDIKTLKSHLPKNTVKQLQRENRYYQRLQNSAALLELQNRIHHDS